MTTLSREVRNIQNPALGAVLIWQFTCGYMKSHPTQDPPPFHLIFIVLPIILHKQTEEFISSTNKTSGLRKFAVKFGEAKNCKQDLLLAIHERMLVLRALTMESFRLALASRLLSLKDANVIPLSKTKPKAGIPQDIISLNKSAEKLGHWCGSLTMHEIATMLKVRF